MQKHTVLRFAAMSLGVVAYLLSAYNQACSTDDDNPYTDTDTDSDTDSGTESDSDSATETDSEEDVDSDSDTDTDTSEIIYESGIFDPELPDWGGPAFMETQFLGSRFTITSPVRVTEICGRMNIFDYSPGSLFGAIVRTDGNFPLGDPWFKEEMVGETLFDESIDIPTDMTMDHWIPLDVELDPGNYVLVFGCYSIDCDGYMSEQSEDTPEGKDSYVKWGDSEGWFNSNSSTRFVVKGDYL